MKSKSLIFFIFIIKNTTFFILRSDKHHSLILNNFIKNNQQVHFIPVKQSSLIINYLNFVYIICQLNIAIRKIICYFAVEI